MSIKERTWEEIQKDETQSIAINQLLTSANQVVIDQYIYDSLDQMGFQGEPIYGGELSYKGFKARKQKGECMQRLIKEMYSSYGKQCNNFPEVRFMIYPDNSCILDISDGKKVPYF